MRPLKPFAVLILVAGAFATGYFVRPATRPDPESAAARRRPLYYVDPMHPAYKSDKPGIAPDCGMRLQPVYAGESEVTVQRVVDDGNRRSAAIPADAIRISPERQQLIGVKFATVESGGASRSIRAVGKVTADETRIGHVHTRIDGWIETLFVDFTGQPVRKGEPMLTIYSPEMLASQQELLLARRARDLMNGNPLASAAQHGDALFEAARRRLQLWDLSDEQIQQVLRTGQPIRSITIQAPMSGFVTERKVFPNQKVTPDSDLYTITDLSRVWIVADVFESDAASVRVGDLATVSFAGDAAPPLRARVSYIQPSVDPATRTLQVRLDAANPGVRMKPDMFVDVEFGVATPPQLTVPADAVLDTGTRRTVFVDLGDGYLEPRQVAVGDRLGDRIAVTRGLAAGERVVSSGTFLIDSESQLEAAAGGMGAPPIPDDSGPSPHGHGAPSRTPRPSRALAAASSPSPVDHTEPGRD